MWSVCVYITACAFPLVSWVAERPAGALGVSRDSRSLDARERGSQAPRGVALGTTLTRRGGGAGRGGGRLYTRVPVRARARRRRRALCLSPARAASCQLPRARALAVYGLRSLHNKTVTLTGYRQPCALPCFRTRSVMRHDRSSPRYIFEPRHAAHPAPAHLALG